jgi:hypothetical protein
VHALALLSLVVTGEVVARPGNDDGTRGVPGGLVHPDADPNTVYILSHLVANPWRSAVICHYHQAPSRVLGAGRANRSSGDRVWEADG